MSERDARGPEDMIMSATEWRGPSEEKRSRLQSLMSAFLMISPNDCRSVSMVAAKVAVSW